jgi:hypothetical protein
MDILGKARRLESRIARTLDGAAARVANTGPREPLEVLHAIVEAVEREVQPAGRGTHVFPFNRLKLAVSAPSPEARARFEAVFEGPPALQDRLVDRLCAAGCDVAGLSVKVAYVPHADAHWTHPDFHLELARVPRATRTEAAADAPLPRLELTIVNGSAAAAAYAFTLSRIDLGRCAEVRDSGNRLIRTNHVAFADAAGELNQSVSRRHAHIAYAADSGDYRIADDGSAHGTAVLRDGRTIRVPAGSRGVRLQSGDEIALGEARLRVTVVHLQN